MRNAAILTLALFAGWMLAAAPANGALVAQWTFAQAYGRSTPDISGNNHAALLKGAGRFITAADEEADAAHGAILDGSKNQSISYGASAAFNFKQDFTLCAWVKPTALPDGETMILGKDSTLYGLSFYRDGKVYFYVAGGTNHISVPLAMNQWNYLVGTYDGAQLKLYVNGVMRASKPLVLVGNASIAHALSASPGQPLVTGPTPSQTAGFAGIIAQAAVYDAALSAEQIRDNFEHHSPVTPRAAAPLRAGSANGPWSVPLQSRWWRADSRPLAALPGLSNFDRLEGRAGVAPSTLQAAAQSQVREEENHIVFSIPGDPPQLQSMSWSIALNKNSAACGYYVLRYRAHGIDRGSSPAPVFSVIGVDAKNQPVTQPLILDSQLFNDRLWHVVVGKLKTPIRPTQVDLRLATTDSSASMALGNLRFFSSLPTGHPGLVCKDNWEHLALPEQNFQCVDLQSRCNTGVADIFKAQIDKNGLVSDGISDFPAAHIAVNGVPFAVGTSGNNLIQPPDIDPNAGTVQFMGAAVSRKDFFPAGRDNATAFDVGKKVSEVFFVLVGDQPATESRYSVSTVPYAISDIDAIAVELQYKDGTHDFVFP
jgi:hypothetical protein